MSNRADLTSSVTFGTLFIVIGALALLHEFEVLTLTWSYLLPILLIVAGIAVIVSTQVTSNNRV